jgi:hypothetical protein
LKLGDMMHFVINPVVLVCLFALSIVPFGLLFRVFGKELLPLRREPAVSSYWIRRDPTAITAESLKRQF